MPESRTGGRKPVYYAIAIHLALLLFLGISVRWSWKDENAGIMKAKVVDNKPASKKTAAKPEKKKELKKKDDSKAKLEKKKKEQAALRLKMENQKKLEEQKKRKAQAEAQLKESLAAEETEREEAARQARADEFADKYRAIIRQKVSRNWVRPGSTGKGLQCTVRVRLLASGDVLEAKVVNSSGNSLFDRSVENAVRKASPLPIPQEKDLFDYFREIEFLFNPEDNTR